MTDTITLPRSVVEQALEALKIGHESAHDCAETFHIEMAGYKQQRHEALDAEVKQISDAIGALHTALEQPQGEQEPVRVFFPRHTPQHGEDWAIDPAFLRRVLHRIEPDTPCEFTPSPEQIESVLLALEVIPSSIYTRPQPKREPLTDEQIVSMWKFPRDLSWMDSVVRLVRAVERAHGIGGKA